MQILGWICLAIYTATVAVLYIPNRNVTGDRGAGLIIPLMMVPAILFFAALLGVAQYRGWKSAVAVISVLLTVPILFWGPVVAGNFISSYTARRNQELGGQFRDPILSEMGAAIRESNHHKLKQLLTAHPNPDWTARDKVGFTLLGLAVQDALKPMIEGHAPDCVRVLVQAGAPFQDDARGPNTRILANLITTLRQDQTELLTLLLKAGANPNEKDNAGTPALVGLYMEAYIAKPLLDAGAELRSLRSTEEQFQGYDALMMATMRARWDLALLYLERGCDPHYQAKDGQSAQTLASGKVERHNYVNEKINRNAFLQALAQAK